MLYADVHGTVALPKIAPLRQVVDPGISLSLFSLPSSYGLRCSDRQLASCKDHQLPYRIIRTLHGCQVLKHQKDTIQHATYTASKSLGPMALHDFALDGVIKATVSSDGFPVTKPAGIEPGKSERC